MLDGQSRICWCKLSTPGSERERARVSGKIVYGTVYVPFSPECAFLHSTARQAHIERAGRGEKNNSTVGVGSSHPSRLLLKSIGYR